jgi:hypothetical protein
MSRSGRRKKERLGKEIGRQKSWRQLGEWRLFGIQGWPMLMSLGTVRRNLSEAKLIAFARMYRLQTS